MKSKFVSIVLTCVLVLASVASIGCDKQTALKAAEDVLFSINEAVPLVSQLAPEIGAKVKQAATIAGKLRDALASSKASEALGYLEDLIPVFQDIVKNDIPQIHNEQSRFIILTALALANIGLHFLSSNLIKVVPKAVSASPRLAPVFEFDKESVWGKYCKVHQRPK